jgi:hypothetical protein
MLPSDEAAITIPRHVKRCRFRKIGEVDEAV